MKNSLRSIFVLFTIALFCGFVSPKANKSLNESKKERIDMSRGFENHIGDIYNSAGLEKAGLSREVFEKAVTGYYNIKSVKVPVLSVIDFTKKSTDKRLWVINMVNGKLLFNTLVAHGKNTGEQYAEHFSNMPSSNMSSLGFYLTGETYIGKHGKSLALDGLEQGFNDRARERAVVMHSADYVSQDYIDKTGRLGRSWGCPALPPQYAEKIINTTANGSCLFIYYPDKKYEQAAKFLDYKAAEVAFEMNGSASN